MALSNQPIEKETPKAITFIRFFILSALGLFAFFVPFSIAGKETILLDHIVKFLISHYKTACISVVMALIAFGAIYPFFEKRHKKHSMAENIFIIFKLIGLVVAVLYVTGKAPESIMDKPMLPFLFEKLVMSVGILIPIGSIALALLVSYGLLAFVGVLMQPVMRPLFKTPGFSAIDAVASFVGSYSLGLLITNRMYLEGKYSAKEAGIIATGFSTVSATFMIVVANTTNLMDSWNVFFWSSLVITFLVTMITVRIPPIRGMADHKDHDDTVPLTDARIKVAFKAGLSEAAAAPVFTKVLWQNFRDGIFMASSILPSILSIGLLGLLIERETSFFNWLGFAFLPIIHLFNFAEPAQMASALASSLAEMFLPALILKEADLMTRYVGAVCSISSIIFFSGLVPCIMATSIPIKVWHIVVVWFLRMILSLLISAPFAYLAIQQGWLV